MTETLPARTENAAVEPKEYNLLREQARTIAKSGLAPKSLGTPEKVLVVALKGRELGIPPMQALSHIHIVEGKPTVSSELMVALVQRAGHKLRVIETSSEKCVVEGVRRDDPEFPQRLAWTMEDAKKAGVTNKGNWKNYPAAMLRARAISALCRFAFADVLMGASCTPEELGAEVDEEGEVLEGCDGIEAHQQVIGEIEKVLQRIPEGSRPNEKEALSYARKKIGNARQALARLKGLIPDGFASETKDEEEIEEAEVVEEDSSATEKPVSPANLKLLKALADDVYAGREEHGHEWMQREIGHPLEEISNEKAERMIEKLNRKQAEMEEAS